MAARLWDRRTVAAALGAATIAARAPAPADSEPPPDTPLSEGPADDVVLPDARVAEHTDADLATAADGVGRITVEVRVEGQGPFAFLVDTGANRTVVSDDIAARLGLQDGGDASIHGIAGVEVARTVRVQEMTMGQVSSRGLRCPVLSRGRLGADGLLGVDVLRGRHVMFDFEGRQVRMRRSGAVSERAGTESRTAAPGPTALSVVVAPARFRSGQLTIVNATLGGRAITCFLDTGSDSTVGNLALRRLVVAMTPRAVSTYVQLFSVTGQTAMGEVLPLPSLTLGGLRLDRLQAVFADLHVFDLWNMRDRPTLLIGIDILRHFDGVAVDYGRREVEFHLPQRWRRVN